MISSYKGTGLVAKPFSLNEAIAAETAASTSKQTGSSLNSSAAVSHKSLLHHKKIVTRKTTTEAVFDSATARIAHKAPWHQKRTKASKTTTEAAFDSANARIAHKAPLHQKRTKATKTTTEATADRTLLNKFLARAGKKNKNLIKKSEYNKLNLHSKKVSPLKYRKQFQINLPLKRKSLRLHKSRSRKPNQSVKREAKYDKQHTNYIPLLRNIGLLFDNFLDSYESDSFEKIHIREQHKLDNSHRRDNITCSCALQSQSQSQKETTTAIPAPSTQISPRRRHPFETSTQKANNITTSNISSIRQDKNVSLLPTRNTSSNQRNNYGFGPGSSTAFHGSFERNITWNHGNSEYHTRREGNQTSAADHEENSFSVTRNGTSGDGTDRGNRGNRRNRNNTRYSENWDGIETDTTDSESEQTSGQNRGDIEDIEVQNRYKIKRDKEEYPQPVRGRLRRPIPKHKVSNVTESLQSREDYEKSVFNVTKYITSHRGVTEGSGPFTSEDKEIRPTNEAITSLNNLANLKPVQLDNKHTKFVTIIDGYSVTRGKFGTNKITGKAVHVS